MKKNNRHESDCGGLRLGTPVVVSQAPSSVREWGPWQFPQIERLEDESIHVSFHIEPDSARSYGMPKAHSISNDMGRSWQVIPEPPAGSGVRVSDGSKIYPIHAESISLEGLDLSKPVGTFENYGHEVKYYPADRFSQLARGWQIARSISAGESEGMPAEIEFPDVEIPGAVRLIVEGVLPVPRFWTFRPGFHGEVWAPHYFTRLKKGKLMPYWNAAFLASGDGGRTWELRSEIRYDTAQLEALGCDPKAERRIGFSEPDILFIDSDRCISILRTTDGGGVGPTYLSVSRDSGLNWGRLECFDRLGVWPQLARLADGSILAAYGRPGLYIRHLSAKAIEHDKLGAEHWSEPVTIVPPREKSTDTCAYCGLLSCPDGTALIVYSDFNVKNKKGEACKTIMARTVAIE